MGVLAYFVFLRTSSIEYVPQTPNSLSLRAAAARLISSLETPVKFEKSQIFVGNVRFLKRGVDSQFSIALLPDSRYFSNLPVPVIVVG